MAPVRHPVVQISSELHVTARTEGENKGEQRRPLTSEQLQEKETEGGRGGGDGGDERATSGQN